MKSNRPVNLDLGTIGLPITAYASILHRVSGVALLVGVGILLYMLDLSLSGEQGFERVSELLSMPLAKLVVWGVLAALAYHCVAGAKHILQDIGFFEEGKQSTVAAKATLVVAAILIILAGVWIW